MKFVLIVVQISDTWPHDVRVTRRVIESEANIATLYAASEPDVRGCLREGYSLCNWHLFDFKPDILQPEETEFRIPSGKSIATLLRKFSPAV